MKLLPQADFKYLKPTVRISALTSVGCEGSRATGPVLKLFGKPGAVGRSTRKVGHVQLSRDNKCATWNAIIISENFVGLFYARNEEKLTVSLARGVKDLVPAISSLPA